MTSQDDRNRRWANRSDREGGNREKALREREVCEKAPPKPKPKPKDRPLFEGADDPIPSYDRD